MALNTSEAKVSVEALNNETEMLYCIACEAMVKPEHEHSYSGHVKVVKMLGGIEFLDFCYFPRGYTFRPPPVVPFEEPTDGDWAAQDDETDEAAELADFVAAWGGEA